jgi:uncharacterized repeat protein (TIGR02543 family)
LVDGLHQDSTSSYTFNNIDQNHTIEASFAINTYTITSSVVGNGTITPSGVTSVNHGSNQSYTWSAGTGYHFSNLLVDGLHQDSTSSYTFNNIDQNHTIEASFDINTYTITSSVVGNGTITSSGVTSVNHGSNQSYTWSAGTGYHFSNLLVDGLHQDSTSSYTFNNIDQNHTIEVNFDINTYTITVNAVNGTVTKSPDQATYNYGTSVQLTATAITGYHFVNWTSDLTGSTNPANITMDGNKTVTANFVINTYTITSSVAGDGTITPSGVTSVNHGSNQSYTWSAGTGYHFSNLLIDGLHQDSTSSYTFNNIDQNHTIEVNFDINTYTITSSVVGNGTITPSGVTSVNHGSNQSYTWSAGTGYHFSNLLVDGLHQDSTSSYTFYNVINNHTISAYFSITCSTLILNPSTLPDGIAGVAYSQTLTALAGTSPYTFVVSSGSLPSGLSLDSDGIISGSPIAHGASSFTVTVTDFNGCTGNQVYSLTINCADITMSPTSLPAGDSGVAYNQPITASGGIGPYVFTLTNGTLPSGLSLTSAGVLSGTTDAIGSYNITITATDSIGCIGTQDYALIIYDNRPFASFAANPNPAACSQSVSFDANGSSHGRPDRSIVSYGWNFGDSNTDTGSTATHAFGAYGTYTVTLTVTDDNVPPKTAITTTVVTVNQGNQPPIANAGGPYTVEIGNSLILNGAASSDPNASCGDAIVNYSWDINNDGTYGDLTGAAPTVSEATVTGLGIGTHTIGLRVTDTFGATGTASTTIIIPDNRPSANVKIFLQGSYNGTSMNTSLYTILPLTQPYNSAPWNYNGIEQVSVIPPNVVDWVLIELRDSTSGATKVGERAAFILNDGSIVDTNGTSPIIFPELTFGNYYIVIRHRNHLAVMSASSVTLTSSSSIYDFTTGLTRYYGGDAKNLDGTNYGMYAGDYSNDGYIDGSDYIGPDNDRYQNGYLRSDLNMDGYIDGSDFVSPDNNRYTGSNVPE